MDFKLRKSRVVCVLLGFSLTALCLYAASGDAPIAPAFRGESSALKATVIVPTLPPEAPEGKNVVWCASFVCAWKAFETDVAKRPIAMVNPPAMLAALQKAADPRSSIPDESLYVAAGWIKLGIIDRIKTDLAKKFPAKTPPAFPKADRLQSVVYAYLEANAKFKLPYFQSREGMQFVDRKGTMTKVSCFGLRSEDEGGNGELRKQPAVLHRNERGSDRLNEYVIDLDRRSQPNQIVVAMLSPDLRLGEKIALVEEKLAAAEKAAIVVQKPGDEGALDGNDILLVPDVVWSIAHRYKELEDRQMKGGAVDGWRILVAQQDIQFRLDRSGAELKSEVTLGSESRSARYVFDRPFLIYMKKRGAKAPFFVLWVDNAELLRRH